MMEAQKRFYFLSHKKTREMRVFSWFLGNFLRSDP